MYVYMVYIYRAGQKKKKNAHKAETLLFGKSVKKLIITSVSIINCYAMRNHFYGKLKVFFFKKLENKGKGIISICSNFDVNGCFDIFYQFVFTKRF